MTPTQEVDYILDDCFFAVGQAVGTQKSLDFEAIRWWRARYRAFFLHAMTSTGTSWVSDRHRVTAVGRFLGQARPERVRQIIEGITYGLLLFRHMLILRHGWDL